MKQILTAREMQAADERTIALGTPSQTLMERAARAALDVLLAHFDTTSTLFLCGAGNNGGDGLAMARFFAEYAGKARVLYLGALNGDGSPDTAKMSAECARQYSLLSERVKVVTDVSLTGVTAVVDAIFGIGLSRAVTGRAADVIDAVNKAAIPVLAVDIPSGIRADSGEILGTALRAAHTVAMAAYKFGHFLYPGAALCGKISCADIGIHTPSALGALLEARDLDSLPTRPARAHKGSFGRVLIIGGSACMSGAAYLAAKAAYRTGAGLVEILCPEQNRVIHQTQLPEALVTCYDPAAPDESICAQAIRRADAIAIGMGLGRGECTAALITLALTNAKAPLVVDADALNEIAATPELMLALQRYEAPKIITPHLGEMSRLVGKPIPEISRDMPSAAMHAANVLNATVVLKEARTVICDQHTLYVNTYGNSGMATGGSGDVLAGMIAAFLAAGNADAAVHGVLAHALAGDAARDARGSHGLMASDIIDALCKVLP